MAIIRFKCTVCKREIEIPENKKGLEIIKKCIITDDCRGELDRIDRKIDFIRGELPPDVNGLDNWVQRNILFNFVQTISSADWTIVHNLGVNPSVQVEVERAISLDIDITQVACEAKDVSGGTELIEITPESIEIISPNEIIIHFAEPESGKSQLIARSSAPKTTVVEEAIPSQTFQLTNTEISANPIFEAELSIATLDTAISNSTINVEITYITPTSTIVHTYMNVGAPSSTSPWNDFSKILVQGNVYTVRSFSSLITEMRTGIIPNGSSFFISNVTFDGSPAFRPPVAEEFLLLLSQSPYANVDKIVDNVIDVVGINATNSELSFFFTDGELHAFRTLFTTVFPHIREV